MFRLAASLILAAVTCALMSGCHMSPDPLHIISPDYSFAKHGPSKGDAVAAHVSVADAD